ncbi:hypothetical protein Tco_0795477 [Tanacetum coccineum]
MNIFVIWPVIEGIRIFLGSVWVHSLEIRIGRRVVIGFGELKALFAQQAEQELLQTTRDFHACKQEEGISIERTVLSTIAEVAKERRKPLEQSMECEMQSIKDNEVWILVELPPNGSKRDVWVSCYTEAVYLTDSETSSLRRLEMCFVFYGGAVDWKSGQAKHFFATSSAEA